MVFPITEVNGNTVTLAHTGRDVRFSLQLGDRVELLDESDARNADSMESEKVLYKVLHIDHETQQIRLSGEHDLCTDDLYSPFLRRWEHETDNNTGTINIVEAKNWLELEDGVKIKFSAIFSDTDNPITYNI